jgi:opacity protein-like surface antigen
MGSKCLWLIGFLVVSPSATLARAEDARIEVHLNGLFAWGDLDFSETRTFRVGGRDVPVTAAYDLDSAFGFDGGLQVNVLGPLALRGSVSHATHEGAGRLGTSLPPLLPGLPSEVEAALPDGRVSETAVHVSAVLSLEAGPARVSALGGVTFFDLEASLLESLDVTLPGGTPLPVPGVPNVDVSDSPTGWHVGAGVDFQVAQHVALGGFLRYSRATAELVPPRGNVIELDAGGAHAGVGLRLMF